PQSDMEKTLYAVDEVTGLIHAAALMRPSRSVLDMELKSVKKKYKAKAFAAGVNRDVIERGAMQLGISVDQLIAGCLAAMQACAAHVDLPQRI
ncbi:MAG: hydrolase, partial [Eubacteriales bacterium]|nr:hydrolase [Eubacteriales bacterium]